MAKITKTKSALKKACKLIHLITRKYVTRSSATAEIARDADVGAHNLSL